MTTTLLHPPAVNIRGIILFLLVLLAAPAAAAAQGCNGVYPPCPPDQPPTVSIHPEGGTFTSPEMYVDVRVSDDYELVESTFEVTITGGEIVNAPQFLFDGSATSGGTRLMVRLSPGMASVVTGRMCDTMQQCHTTSVTFYYAPPPPPPDRGAPVVDLGPQNQEARIPSAFEVRGGYGTPAYVSLDALRSLGLLYSSELASPTAFIYLDASTNSATLPDRMSIAVEDAAGKPVRFSNGTTENFYAAGAGTARLAAQWDASGLSTGVHSYTVIVRNWWGTEYRQTRKPVRVLVVDERQSPYGAGWTVAGLQRLHAQPDGSLVLTGGNGSAALYALGTCDAAGCRYTSPVGDFSILEKVVTRDAAGTATSEEYRRRMVDGTVLAYRTDGRLTSVADRLGNRMELDYDAAGRLTAARDPIGQQITLAYDAAGRLSSIRDPGGRTSAVVIDRPGNLVRITDPDGVVAFRAHYGDRHRLMQQWDRTGAPLGFTYDAAGRIARQLLPGVETDEGPVRPEVKIRSWEAAHLPAPDSGSFARPATRVTPAGAWAEVTDPRGKTTRTALDRWGQPARARDSEGQVTTWVRNGAGQVTEITSSTGSREVYAWSGPDLLQIRNPVTGAVTNLEYEGPYRQLKMVIQGDAIQLLNHYGDRRLLDSASVGTSTTRYEYDARGRVTFVSDPEGHETRVAYQPAGMQNTESVSAVRGPDTRTSSFTYDALGRLRTTTDPAGRVGKAEYDLLNRTTRVSGPDSTVVKYGYDDFARRYTVTDPVGQTYTTLVNALGWTESSIDPRNQAERFTYDRNGNVKRYVNRRQQQVTFTYDDEDRLRTRTADGRTTTFAYDSARKWVAAITPESADTLYINDQGQLVEAATVRNGLRFALASSYTDEGLRNRLVATASAVDTTAADPWIASQPLMEFGTDEYFRLNNLMAFGEPVGTGFEYTPDQMVGAVVLPTQTATDPTRLRMSFGYTPYHLPDTIAYNKIVVDATLGRRYGYDELDRIRSIVKPRPLGGSETRTLAYDSVGRLAYYDDVERTTTRERVCGTIEEGCFWVTTEHADTLRAESYSYDRVGNRTDRGAALETGNRLTSFDGYTLRYDEDGNLVRKFRLDAAGAVTYDQTLSWNSLGELESVTTNGSTTTFGYDGWGRRVRKTTGGATTGYVWDGDDLALELDGAGALVRAYSYYPGVDQPHSVTHQGGAILRYAPELPGHVAGLVGAGNTVANTYTYTPFGEPLTTNEQVPQPLRYMAREYDAETGLYYVRARYYDPQQGRFVSEDPIGLAGGINLYAYVGSDPANATDPFGLADCSAIAQMLLHALGFSESWIQSACRGGWALPGITVRGSTVQHGTSNFANPNARGGNHSQGLNTPASSPRPSGPGGDGIPRVGVGPTQDQCGSMPPQAAGNGTGPYAPGDSYMGVSAVHMYQHGGNGAWAQRVRSCLVCSISAHGTGAESMDSAHRYCYNEATAAVGGWEAFKGYSVAVWSAASWAVTHPTQFLPNVLDHASKSGALGSGTGYIYGLTGR